MRAMVQSDGFAGGILPTVADRPPAARRWLEAAIQPAANLTGDDPGPTRLPSGARFVVHPAGDGWTGKGTNRSKPTDSAFVASQAAAGAVGVGRRRGPARCQRRIRWCATVRRHSGRVRPRSEVMRSQLVRDLAEFAFAPLAASRARGLVWRRTARRLHPCGSWDRTRRDRPSHRRWRWRRSIGPVAGSASRPNGRAGYMHEPYRLEFDRHERLSSGERIPLRASGTFETADGDWPYWRFEVLDEG